MPPKAIAEVVIPTEHEEQKNFVQWFRRKYPSVRIFAIPNGGARNPATACRLKVEGVLRGVPDLFIPEWRLWIEMKRIKGGVLSPEQKDWIEYLKNNDYVCMVGYGCEGAIREVEEWRKEISAMR